MDTIFLAPKVVSDIPIVGAGLPWRISAALNILCIHRLAVIIPPNICTDRGTGDGATGRRDILTASAADLMA